MEDSGPETPFGLALSGGGFRAALFHLGVIRFLRDADLLRQVSVIGSVSGGSVIGAHLALNWERYCGTDEDFDAVAAELIRFIQLDIRNRIVRRFPIASVANGVRRLTRIGHRRQLTRAGLLERYYERYLFGETPLFDLPQSPKLYILSTDVSEGSLCAFHRDGLLLQRRSRAGKPLGVELIEMGLATVPMAVAASSAFPGFFPPLELSGQEVGASAGEFSRHALTDGGIFDNLGLRFFHHLERSEQIQFKRIFASDAGAAFRVQGEGRAGGLLRTALRSSDILMSRVNQMELESFEEKQQAVFIPITRQVAREEDVDVLHPEIQWQAALMRTDMDRFSPLEVSALLQHGYCVARQVAIEQGLVDRSTAQSFSVWDSPAEIDPQFEEATRRLRDPALTLRVAKDLQRSGKRRTVRTLLSASDWPSYVWAAILVVLVATFPYLLYKSRRTAIRQSYVLSAVAQTSPVYRDVLEMLEDGPEPVPELQAEAVDEIAPLDFTGYDVVTDDRIYDLRGWRERHAGEQPPVMHARFRVRRNEQAADNPLMHIQLPSDQPTMFAEYLPKTLHTRSFVQQRSDDDYLFETQIDFSNVPVGSDTDLIVRQYVPQTMARQGDGYGNFRFTIGAKTSIVRIWVLLPDDREHTEFQLVRFPLDDPGEIELVEATTTVSLPIGAIANFELINPEDGYRYECRWLWTES